MTLSMIDRDFIARCQIAKDQSHDPDRQVGAVIASSSGYFLASGSNRPPAELKLTSQESHRAIERDPDWKYFMLEHAERNAISDALSAGHTLHGATIYSTLFPCADCARAIVEAGIVRLVVPAVDNAPHRNDKWRDHFHYAKEIFRLAHTQVDTFMPSDLDFAARMARDKFGVG